MDNNRTWRSAHFFGVGAGPLSFIGLAVAYALSIAACGDAEPTQPGAPITEDAGDQADGNATETGGNTVVAPTAATLPALNDWLCPPGWGAKPALINPSGKDRTPAGMKQFSRCEPPAQLACPAGQTQILGDAACVSVGAACPTGEWSDALPSGSTIVYVRPGATDGNGSQSSPYGTLAAAYARPQRVA